MHKEELKAFCYHEIGVHLNNALEEKFSLSYLKLMLGRCIQRGIIIGYKNLRVLNDGIIKGKNFDFLIVDMYDDKYVYSFQKATPMGKTHNSFWMSCRDIESSDLQFQGMWKV